MLHSSVIYVSPNTARQVMVPALCLVQVLQASLSMGFVHKEGYEGQMTVGFDREIDIQ